MLPIRLTGACTHNLRHVDLELIPGQVVAIAGVSGSGKSSLAIDTLYAEGQRRFVESFSPYARQFLERLERPPVTRLEPVAAGIAVDRRAPVKSSRSTVATMADIEPYFAALFACEARPVCPEHGVLAELLDVAGATERAQKALEGTRAVITYPVAARGPDGYLEVRETLLIEGYRRLWFSDAVHDLDSVKPSQALDRNGALEVVVDRVVGADAGRLSQAIESAWGRSGGLCYVHGQGVDLKLQKGLSCPSCGILLEAPKTGLFSYESPLGACPGCRGFGRTLGVDLDKVIPDPALSLKEHAIRPWRGKSTQWERAELAKLCKREGIPRDKPWQSLTSSQRRSVLEGDGDMQAGLFPGVLGWFRWLETRTYKMHVRVLLARYRSYDPCKTCQGQRLNATALSYRVAGKTLADFHQLEVCEARALLADLNPRNPHGQLACRELESRLRYLERVGLGYLTLDRQARTLSGGEAQRVTLTAALGTSLHNALFVLDEPTVGLHPSDVGPLSGMMRELAERHNVVLVIEHEPAILRAADRIVELGPGAGERGGRVVLDGEPGQFVGQGTATGRALRGALRRCGAPRSPRGVLWVRGATENNLRGIDVRLPLGVLCAVSGPSGSGKSTLVEKIVYRALCRWLGKLDVEAEGAHQSLVGADAITRVVLVDQTPLGRTSRGNAATYTKAWDPIRALYAKQPQALVAGLGASDFSFNVPGGRCEACTGEGFETVEMQFLADVRLICPVCKAARFQERVLAVEWKGASIAAVLESTVENALALFCDQPAVLRALGPLQKLGLGYLRLGQPLSTLSGGEAQRLKLARALAENQKDTLFILDEPSAGLHADEVQHLLEVLGILVDSGSSVLVVEHDLDVIANADHILDLGPGAGREGGTVVAQGSLDDLLRADGRTSWALREHLKIEHPKTPPGGLARPDPPSRGVTRGPAPPLEIRVTRAREHNLRDVSVTIPHRALTVVTGPSGSGKSTLAFDVVFAEGQRRFLETLTPYARQFLPSLPRPEVDRVSGVPPSIALEQRTARAGGQSTVATVTEVAHYLRLLYAKLGVLHCPTHDRPIARMSESLLMRTVRETRGRVTLCAPVIEARKGTHLEIFSAAARAGIKSAFCDGELVSTDLPPKLARNREHSIELVIAENVAASELGQAEIGQALRWGKGAVQLRLKSGALKLLSTSSACPECGFSMPELDPRWFSFNTRQGRCEACEGAGVVEVAVPARGRKDAQVSRQRVCPDCAGARLAPIPRGVRLLGERYSEVVQRPVTTALERVRSMRFEAESSAIADPILSELLRRLEFLEQVGLGYLSLDRAAHSLSGGEMQRLRLSAQLGAGLTGALYVLDEPTIGLHPRDTGRLLDNLRKLVDLGSTVLVVEHDADTIRAADHLIDLGPGGGVHGGRVLAEGRPRQVFQDPNSPTGRALAEAPELRSPRSLGRDGPYLKLLGACENNLKNLTAQIPLERFIVVAGVSGSGKSTLIRRVLLPALRRKLGLVSEEPGAHQELFGYQALKRAISIDQSPIGRTPRSVPATFLGIWDAIRKLFAASTPARMRGFGPARFSFNSKGGGQCEICQGQGHITHQMSFLPDVVSACPSCNASRFERSTLEVRHLGHSIGEVLGLSAEEATQVFANHPSIGAPLRTLSDLGAGYIKLGQGSHTLSGGEAQRLKLAAELTATARHEPTLYVLDEPTTGLHVSDVSKLMRVLSRLVERGDTLVVIEHHPQVLAGADWLIELGPEGGEGGGQIVASGPPRQVARGRTATAEVLRQMLCEPVSKARQLAVQ